MATAPPVMASITILSLSLLPAADTIAPVKAPPIIAFFCIFTKHFIEIHVNINLVENPNRYTISVMKLPNLSFHGLVPLHTPSQHIIQKLYLHSKTKHILSFEDICFSGNIHGVGWQVSLTPVCAFFTHFLQLWKQKYG